MNFKIIFFLYLFSIISVNAQYDWRLGELVLRNQDTIKGFIQIPMINRGTLTNSKRIQFKESLEGKIRRYDYTNTRELIFKGLRGEISLFEFIRTSQNKVQLFKRVYASSKTRLYARKVGDLIHDSWADGSYSTRVIESSSYNEYYVQRKYEKNATPLIKLMGPAILYKSFRKNAMNYFSDCPALVARLKNKTLRESQILKIVRIYDQCE